MSSVEVSAADVVLEFSIAQQKLGPRVYSNQDYLRHRVPQQLQEKGLIWGWAGL